MWRINEGDGFDIDEAIKFIMDDDAIIKLPTHSWPISYVQYESINFGDCLTHRLVESEFEQPSAFMYADDLTSGFGWPWGEVLCTA